ncbi:DUF3152 domain-containing protein [Kineosporia sp. NBRC 101731]|uniref:DUF3152 domain-containing protein n=1 Tax=Kineosporia sp. NBRC 101731 TaxID=3032199 RepID=UPI00255325A9|nr:DUF3152 domain-containing protein [Kineosporia sp. NBRC 101731]
MVLLAVVTLLLSGCLTGVTITYVPAGHRSVTALPTPSPTPSAVATSTRSKAVPITYPRAGKRTWTVAPGHSRVAGSSGRLFRYRVAVERDISGVTADQFARTVVKTLGGARGWTATGDVRLQRVAAGRPADFTIYLATPKTRDQLCGDEAVGHVDEYTSCRNGANVVVNVARWVHGVPRYGASLGIYREYVINHETGHALGHSHELCPGAGKKAPVMQQQTLGLHGCTANGWPVVKGRLLTGALGQYDDPVPSP